MFRTTLAVCVLLVTALAAQAGVMVTSTYIDTPGLPGYRTYTLTATSDNPIIGFNFAQPNYGFFGQLNQVNPSGLPTVFQNNNALFSSVGAVVSQDSQFLFNSNALVLPAGYSSESGSQLRSIFASVIPLGTTVAFAQVAALGRVQFQGSVAFEVGNDVVEQFVSGETCPFCDPGSFPTTVINVPDPNVPGFVERTVNGFGSLSNFRFHSYQPAPGSSGAGPATAATYDFSTRKFHWDTVGSPFGIYEWRITASTIYGSTDGAFIVRLVVPEPTTVGLLGAIICFPVRASRSVRARLG